MPIREWSEEIHIRCSDAELPKAMAALSGNYQPDTYVTYQSSESSELNLLSYAQPAQPRLCVPERSYCDG